MSFSFTVAIYADETLLLGVEENQLTLVFAAEMPDVSDDTNRYPELAQLLLSERQANPQTFFIFGGGSIGPSPLANLDRGSHIVDILNSLEPDAMGVAKREFSFLEDELSLRAYEAVFPFVASNMRDTRTGMLLDGLVESTIVTKNNIKMGVISIIHSRLLDEYLIKHVEVLDPLASIHRQSSKLKQANVDIIVLHYFYPFDFIDALLEDKVIDFAYIANTSLKAADMKQYKNAGQYIVSSELGHASVVKGSLRKVANAHSSTLSNQAFEVTEVQSAPLNIPLPTVKIQVDEYRVWLDKLLNYTLGFWQSDATTLRDVVRSEQNAFANYIVDTMREFSQADIALINGGSIRGNARYSMGEAITRQTIATELPFRSTLAVLNISGRDLLTGIQHGFSRLQELRGQFPHVSGMQIEYFGNDQNDIPQLRILIDGQELEADQYYKLATTDYLARGGDGYRIFLNARSNGDTSIQETLLISDLVLRDIQTKGQLAPTLDDRYINSSSQMADVKNMQITRFDND